jgi:formylglycine-generating enzyme required for sulfatase activity
MNGSGMMVWENVFGQWMGWSERDKSILRAMLPVQRRYHWLFNDENWTPLVATLQAGVFASLWEGKGLRLWTCVNRHEHAIGGDLLKISGNNLYYDLIRGRQIPLEKNTIKSEIAPRSIGCYLVGSKKDLGEDFSFFLSSMRKLHKKYNSNSSQPSLVPTLKNPAQSRSSSVQQNMVELKPHTFNQTVEFVVREVGDYSSAMNISVSPQLGDPYVQQRMVHVPHMAIDVYPVTNAQYYEFLQSSRYEPREKYLFLRHWINGKPPAEKENHPVVYVDLDDARAYAAWAGKRLPTEQEWQFAAQGYDQLRYPCGKELKDGAYNSTRNTTAVDAYPAGKSPFGCMDMCGNAWEMTESEYADKYNRFCILKGGSYFKAEGSMWYTSGGPVPSYLATKFLMMYPGLDRCSTVGFRCAVDL